jgi:hypothetical protein
LDRHLGLAKPARAGFDKEYRKAAERKSVFSFPSLFSRFKDLHKPSVRLALDRVCTAGVGDYSIGKGQQAIVKHNRFRKQNTYCIIQ